MVAEIRPIPLRSDRSSCGHAADDLRHRIDANAGARLQPKSTSSRCRSRVEPNRFRNGVEPAAATGVATSPTAGVCRSATPGVPWSGHHPQRFARGESRPGHNASPRHANRRGLGWPGDRGITIVGPQAALVPAGLIGPRPMCSHRFCGWCIGLRRGDQRCRERLPPPSCSKLSRPVPTGLAQHCSVENHDRGRWPLISSSGPRRSRV